MTSVGVRFPRASPHARLLVRGKGRLDRNEPRDLTIERARDTRKLRAKLGREVSVRLLAKRAQVPNRRLKTRNYETDLLLSSAPGFTREATPHQGPREGARARVRAAC